MTKKNIFLIVCIISLLYTFPAYNKYWAPYDEGIITVAAQRVLAGEVPYRDFFIIMYPPGQVYAVAFILKFISYSFTAIRIYAVLVSVGISLIVYLMSLSLSGNLLVSLFAWFIALVSSAPRLGAIPAPIWPGVLLGMAALYAYQKCISGPGAWRILGVGVLAGLAALFRHDIGIFAIAAIGLTMIAQLFSDRKSFRDVFLFLGGIFIVIAPCLGYLVFNSAVRDMWASLFLFPFVHMKTAAIGFPAPCWDLRMIFHGSLHFIKVNQYYTPVIIYVSAGFHFLACIFRERGLSRKNSMLLPVIVFGALTFNQVRVRTDPAHLLTVIYPALVLFAFMFDRTFSNKTKKRALFNYTCIGLALFLCILLAVKNMDKYAKNAFIKPYRKDIIKTQFDAGSVYIPKEEREDLVKTVRFIKSNADPSEKIYVGNTVHWKDDFGGSLIIYFLADRLPAVKYYELAPGLVTDPKVHSEIRDSIIRHKVNLIVLQDIDTRGYEEKRNELDDYIRKHFRQVEKFGKFNLHKRL